MTTLSVTKTCSPSPVVPGTAFNCEVTVTNTGANIAYGVGLTDIMVDIAHVVNSYEVLPGTDQTFECSSGMACTLPDPLPAGDTAGVRFLLSILPDAHLVGQPNLFNPQNYVVATALNSPNGLVTNRCCCRFKRSRPYGWTSAC